MGTKWVHAGVGVATVGVAMLGKQIEREPTLEVCHALLGISRSWERIND